MKVKLRIAMYLVVIGTLVTALFRQSSEGVEGASTASVVEAIERRNGERPLVRINERDSAIPSDLFVVDQLPMSMPVDDFAEQAVVPPVSAPPEIKIIGWMRSESTPHVFVEWKDGSYALAPLGMLDDAYRFEGIDQGMAEFTYLPEGTSRYYRVGELGSTE